MLLTRTDKEALAHWGIHHVTAAHRFAGGVSNRVLLLETEAGPFVLRAHRSMPLERLQWEHRIIRYAVEQGVSTPRPLLCKRGRSYIEVDGHCYALFPYLADEQIGREQISIAEAHAAGAFLGELESRLARFPLSEAPRHKLVALEEGHREKTIAAIEELLRVIKAWPEPGADAEWALDHLEAQHYWLTNQSRHLVFEAHPRLTLIHGDFQESNLFFSEGRVSAIIDWERARMAPWGWDIVRALDLMLGLNPRLCWAFLDGFKTTAALDKSELFSTAGFYGAEREMDTWMFRAIYLEGNERARRFLKPSGFRPFSEKWEELWRNY